MGVPMALAGSFFGRFLLRFVAPADHGPPDQSASVSREKRSNLSAGASISAGLFGQVAVVVAVVVAVAVVAAVVGVEDGGARKWESNPPDTLRAHLAGVEDRAPHRGAMAFLRRLRLSMARPPSRLASR